mmetsp:Transcript_3649/g.7818  ORF Transcript_3649/g.7818 Transcript_3649/m.7818 type:complete len:246 (+) Transcript_3649:1217-1954(+)
MADEPLAAATRALSEAGGGGALPGMTWAKALSPRSCSGATGQAVGMSTAASMEPPLLCNQGGASGVTPAAEPDEAPATMPPGKSFAKTASNSAIVADAHSSRKRPAVAGESNQGGRPNDRAGVGKGESRKVREGVLKGEPATPGPSHMAGVAAVRCLGREGVGGYSYSGCSRTAARGPAVVAGAAADAGVACSERRLRGGDHRKPAVATGVAPGPGVVGCFSDCIAEGPPLRGDALGAPPLLPPT